MNEKLMQEVIAKAIAAHGNQENKLLEMLLNPVVIAALFAGVATVIAAMAGFVRMLIQEIRDTKKELKSDVAANTKLTTEAKDHASQAVVVAEVKADENQKALNGRLTQLLAMTAEAEYAKGLANGVHGTIVKQVAADKETNDKNFKDIADTLGKILSRLDVIDDRQKVSDERITRHNENNRLQTDLDQRQIEELNKRLDRVTQIAPAETEKT